MADWFARTRLPQRPVADRLFFRLLPLLATCHSRIGGAPPTIIKACNNNVESVLPHRAFTRNTARFFSSSGVPSSRYRSPSVSRSIVRVPLADGTRVLALLVESLACAFLAGMGPKQSRAFSDAHQQVNTDSGFGGLFLAYRRCRGSSAGYYARSFAFTYTPMDSYDSA